MPVVKELSIATGSVTKWKNGSIPNGETLVKLADYFNVSIDYLLGRDAPLQPLSESEQRLIENFRALSNEGKKYVFQSTIAATALYPAEQSYQIAASGGSGVKSKTATKSIEELKKIADSFD